MHDFDHPVLKQHDIFLDESQSSVALGSGHILLCILFLDFRSLCVLDIEMLELEKRVTLERKNEIM